jgi:hypothetical protein
MKQILIFSLLIILLSSCSFWVKSDDITKAKEELLNQQSVNWNINNSESVKTLTKDNTLTWKIENQSDTIVKKEKIAYYEVENLNDNNFIKIDNLDEKLKHISSGIEITWKTLTNVDKIIVKFENKTSDFPIDVYQLWQFKAGDKQFVYRAKWEFKVLDFWDNEYIFEAYSWDKISKTRVLIHIPEETKTTSHNKDMDNNISYEKKIIWDKDDAIYLSFPKSSSFWEPLNVWTDLITYSNIKDLEIKKVNFSSWTIDCSNMTDYLKENVGWWFYWNTCRDIIKDKWISVYVLRLDWDKYIYEKKYFDFNHGLIWNYIVKDDIKADKENISEDIARVNSQLKETNKDSNIAYENYPELKIVDKLFYEIVR